MNVKEYIESGILEAYVLGALSEGERLKVQTNIAEYPEIAAEVAAIEDAMQKFAEAGAEQPPMFMQDKIWSVITNDSAKAVPGTDHHSKTISLGYEQSRQLNWQRAAVWIALVGSLLANFLLWSQRNSEMDKETVMNSRMDSMQRQQQQLAQIVASYQKKNEMLADTGMQTIVMRSMQPGHPMAATVYWSRQSGDAYVSLDKLPMPPKGMQYQMWMIKDGKPVDMGMLPNNMVASAGMNKINGAVRESQAFAISLEKEGGNPTPTTVYVLGKVAS